jgi:hypothetical protein
MNGSMNDKGPTTRTESEVAHLAAPITAPAIVAQQVGSNASRDALFLSHLNLSDCWYR